MKQQQIITALSWLSLSFFTATLPAQQVPRQSQEFTALTTGGAPLQLSQFRGKTLVVEFFLTECPHCQETASVLDKLQREYRARGVQVIGVAFNADAPARLPELVKRLNLSFPTGTASQLSIFQFLQLSVTRQYSVPFLAFIDSGGTIRAQFTGGDDLFKNAEAGIRSNIEALLRLSPASGAGAASAAKQHKKKE